MLVKLHNEFSLEAMHIDAIQDWTGPLSEEHKKANAIVYIGCKENQIAEGARLILVFVGMFSYDTIYVIPDSNYYTGETLNQLREAINMAKRAGR